jgi:L-threonylcarbamoyladenylate synthase
VVDPEAPDPAALDDAARILRRGGLVAFATETVYGLGALATDERAVSRIYAAKGRPAINPLIVHVASINQARSCVTDWPASAETLVAHFWPGPLTLVLTRADQIPDIVSAGKPTVGLRMPASRVARGLIERTAEPVAAPSANRSNRLSPTRAEHVLADLDGRIDLILDSGPTALGLESTVLDVTSALPRLLRPGPITSLELETVLSGLSVTMPEAGESQAHPSSPGQSAVHYSPRTPSFRVDSVAELADLAHLEEIALVSIGSPGSSLARPVTREFRLESPTEAARLLYELLHQCDSLNVRAIVVVMPPDRPEWLAVRDRLLRATRPWSTGD